MKKSFFVLLAIVLVAIIQIVACNDTPRFANKNAEKGYGLAQKYCISCHQFPDPSLLNKETWLQHVLPKMGNMLGFTSLGSGRYFNNAAASMSLDDWNNIVLYYYTQAPKDPIERSEDYPIQSGKNFFSVDTSVLLTPSPSTSLVQIDQETNQILFADGSDQKLYILFNQQIKDSFNVATGLAHIKKKGAAYWALSMGVLHPSDAKSGNLVSIDSATKKATVLLDSLQRPVDACYGDLNNDGIEDVIIAEFGNTTGALSWFQNKGTKGFEKHLLRPLPGASKSIIYDFNKDGLPDIIALMAQGDEAVFIYYNEGEGKFREERVLTFPPSYGSNSLQLLDFDHDGQIDIMTTNGDNGDYPPILKAYHGIRIFTNDGKNKFQQKLFLPQFGVQKAIADDFDGDGDLDITSIAYFPDYNNNPKEAFLFWQNGGKNNFTPFSIPQSTIGRWMVMDAGDFNSDGKKDIVLGNATFSLGLVPENIKNRWNKYAPSVIILKNTFK